MEPLTIGDSDYVFRRIYPDTIAKDGTLESTSFSDREDTPSCHLQSLANPHKILEDNPGMDRLVRLSVGQIRELGLDVVHDPLPEDHSHCLIVGTEGRKLNRRKRQKLCELAEVVQPWPS